MLKGRTLSPEHRRRIGEGVKNSKKYRQGMKNRKLINPFEGHNYEHGKGDVCKKCGKIHISPMKSMESKRKIGNIDKLIFKVVLYHPRKVYGGMSYDVEVKNVVITKDSVLHHLSLLEAKMTTKDFKRLKEEIRHRLGVRALSVED